MSEEIFYGIVYPGDKLTCPKCREKYLAGYDHICVQVCEWTHVTGFYYKPKCDEELAFHYREGITLWCPYCGKPIKVTA